MIICANYGNISARTVCFVEQTRHDVPYFSNFITKSCLKDLEDVGQGQWSLDATHALMLLVICAKEGKNPPRTIHAAERTRQDVRYFSSFIAKSWLNDLQGMRSKVTMLDTPFHASDHLCSVWKESVQNCTCCRADTTRGKGWEVGWRRWWGVGRRRVWGGGVGVDGGVGVVVMGGGGIKIPITKFNDEIFSHIDWF